MVLPGAAVPDVFAEAPRLTIDEAVLESPEVLAAMTAVLHEAWAEGRRVVVELAASADALREPEVERRPQTAGNQPPEPGRKTVKAEQEPPELRRERKEGAGNPREPGRPAPWMRPRLPRVL